MIGPVLTGSRSAREPGQRGKAPYSSGLQLLSVPGWFVFTCMM